MPFQTLMRQLNRVRIRLTCKLPLIQPQQILEGYENLNVVVPLVSTHWETASLFDHMFIASLVRVINPRACFEIGTSLGLVTSTLAANSPKATQIHTLDLSNASRIGSFFRERPEAGKIRQHFGASSSFDFQSLQVTVDLMFIDGSHAFEDVCLDSKNAFKVLSDRGVIIWHDVSPHFPEVIRALESLPKAGEIYRVQGTGCAFYAFSNAPLTFKKLGYERHPQ
jgi:methyltransferase family protein